MLAPTQPSKKHRAIEEMVRQMMARWVFSVCFLAPFLRHRTQPDRN